MPQKTAHQRSPANTSRRRLLTSIGRVVTMGVCGQWNENSYQNISSCTDNKYAMKRRHRSVATSSTQQSSRQAYVAPPGVSVTSLLANLSQLLLAEQSPPVVLMDRYDYNRLRTQTLQPGPHETCHYLVRAFDEFARRGTIQFLDYADFYQRSVQTANVRQNRELLETLSDSIHRRTAVSANERWLDYGRGQYQHQLRDGLGDEGFVEARQLDKTRSRLIDRGLGTPQEWNERVLQRYTAALTVRQQANDLLDLDVCHVIGEGESTLVGGLRGAADETSHLDRLEPERHITDFMTAEMTTTRELLDQVGEIAVELAGVQHDDWTLLGSTVVLPRYADLFEFDVIEEEIDAGIDMESLIADVERVVTTFEAGSETGYASSTLTYTADWLAEMTECSFATGSSQSCLTDLATYALHLAEYSGDFRTLVEANKVSQTAAFIGLSLGTDPTHSLDRRTIRQQSRHLLGQLGTTGINQSQIDANLRRRDVWDHNADWYQTTDRER